MIRPARGRRHGRLGAQGRRRPAPLPQGKRGRTLIARASICDPRLLLLDAPTSGLDVVAREQLPETVDSLDIEFSDKPSIATPIGLSLRAQ